MFLAYSTPIEVFSYLQWRSLTQMTDGSKTYITKNFYRIGGSKTYILKIIYTKTTYIILLSEKFGGSNTPPSPSILRHCLLVIK
ncbi:hypothetical protein Hanom_Chr15g01358821 [Helianthus anomalus]